MSELFKLLSMLIAYGVLLVLQLWPVFLVAAIIVAVHFLIKKKGLYLSGAFKPEVGSLKLGLLISTVFLTYIFLINEYLFRNLLLRVFGESDRFTIGRSYHCLFGCLGGREIAFIIFVFLVILIGVPLGYLIQKCRDIQGTTKKKRIFGVLVIIVLLVVVTGAASLLARPMGTCETKSCGAYADQLSCLNASQKLGCKWEGRCFEKSCQEYRDETSCTSAPGLQQCTWHVGDKWCAEFSTMPPPFCSQYNNQQENCLQQKICDWTPDFAVLPKV